MREQISKATAMRIVAWMDRWLKRHPRRVISIGLAACIIAAIPVTSAHVYFDPMAAQAALQKKEDIHNLYFAAANATWKQAPGWWVGSWIYPDVGYYRPVTSMLFLSEQRAFGTNFTAYNRVSQIFHLINVGLVYLLTVSLFRNWRRSRVALGAIAAYYFTSSDNSMFFAVARVISWWPAQNDVVSLTFGLLCLLLLDQYLHNASKWLLAGSIVSLFLGIATKEMGFITAPVALALVAQRRLMGIGNWRAPVIAISALTAFMWFFRRIVVPRHWGPVMFRSLILKKMLTAWGGPIGDLLRAEIYWPVVAALLASFVVTIGLRRRWSVYVIALLFFVTIGLCAQFIAQDGNAAVLFISAEESRFWSVLIYLFGAWLFARNARSQPALFTGAALWLVYLPILQYGGGHHYYYWPGAFNAIADAAFVACLSLWIREVAPTLNLEVRVKRGPPHEERESPALS